MEELIQETDDGSLTLFSEHYGESYHSQMGAAKEANDLYLVKSGFLIALESQPATSEFTILDVGLGLGYNALSAMAAFLQKGPELGRLNLVSLEKNIPLVEEVLSAVAPWQKCWPEFWLNLLRKGKVNRSRPGIVSLTYIYGGKHISWDILLGDGTQTLRGYLAGKHPTVNPQLVKDTLSFDFIFQDAFSPKRNPEFWSCDWFSLLNQSVKESCVLATYSAARSVKDALTAAGWQWSLMPSGGQKKHWLLAKPREIMIDRRKI